MISKKTKKPAKQFGNANPVEAIRNVGGGVVKSIAKDVVKDSFGSWWDQMLGVGSYAEKPRRKDFGDLSEGQEVDLSQNTQKQQNEQIPPPYVEPAYDYRREILHGEKKSTQEDGHIIQMQIREIIIELKKLANASSELQIQFKEATIEQMPVNPGKYHINFFEWLLATITTARMRVEESANWLSLFASKKQKRQYWNMFKKHGTTFGLSNERVVATQTG